MCNLWGTSFFIEDLETGLGKDSTKLSQKLTFRHKKLTYDVIFLLIMTSSKSSNRDFWLIFAEAWFWKTLKEGDIMICVCGRKFSRKKKVRQGRNVKRLSSKYRARFEKRLENEIPKNPFGGFQISRLFFYERSCFWLQAKLGTGKLLYSSF